MHKNINKKFSLIFQKTLPRNSFYLPETNKDYNLNTVFQVWTGLKTSLKNLRKYSKEPIKHKDFTMLQYNNTEAALKCFDNDFDVAIPSQGWQDYDRREFCSSNCEKNKQWMLIKAKNLNVLERLMAIDYKKLAKESATIVPGFRKNDLIEAYNNFCNQNEAISVC